MIEAADQGSGSRAWGSGGKERRLTFKFKAGGFSGCRTLVVWVSGIQV